MFQFLEPKGATIEKAPTLRTEVHGKDHVRAMSFRLKFRGPNTLIDLLRPDLREADPQTVGEAVVTGPGPMPRFSFTPEQLRDLAAYAVSLRNGPHPGGITGPTVGPVTEGFIAGLGLLVLLLVARFIGVRQRRLGSRDADDTGARGDEA